MVRIFKLDELLYVFRFLFLKRSEAGGRRQEAGRLITEYCSLVSVCVEVLTDTVLSVTSLKVCEWTATSD